MSGWIWRKTFSLSEFISYGEKSPDLTKVATIAKLKEISTQKFTMFIHKGVQFEMWFLIFTFDEKFCNNTNLMKKNINFI